MKDTSKVLSSGLQKQDKEAEGLLAQVVTAANAQLQSIRGRFNIHI